MKFKNNKLNLAISAILVTGMMSVPTVVSAQAAPSEDDNKDELEIIEVTARGKIESIREIPVAIKSFGAGEIASAGLTDVQDLAKATAGFSYHEGFGRTTGNASKRPSIRGMSSILGSPNASFYVDGVFVDGPIGSFNLENLERVEVIKGPQSAAFGRGAFAGAVNFITRRPTEDFKGNVTVNLAQDNYHKINGHVSGGIVKDILAGEFYFSDYDQGGLYDNLATGKKDLGEESTQQVGVRFNWTPNDNLTAYLDYSHTEDEDGQIAYGLWNGGVNEDPTIKQPIDVKVNCFEPTATFVVPYSFFATAMETRTRGYWCGEITALDGYFADNDGAPGNSRETDRLSLIVDYDFDEWSFNSTSGYTNYDYRNGFGSYGDGSSGSFGGRDGQKSFSTEASLVSSYEAPLNYLVGAYYFKSQSGELHSNSWDLETEDFDPSEESISQSNSQVKNTAIFGMLDYEISDKLDMSFEARFQKEEIILDADAIHRSDSIEFSSFLPRFAVTYKMTEDTNVYGSIAKGNKPGGFNTAYYSTNYWSSQLDEAEATGNNKYDESNVIAYEVGTKSLLLDGDMTLHTSLYYLDWEKQILTNTESLVNVDEDEFDDDFSYFPESILLNAGKSEVLGLEFDMQWQVSDELSLSASYARSEAEFKDYIDENVRDLHDTNGLISDPDDFDGQVAGNRLPQTPENMVNLGIQYRESFGEDLEGFVRLDYSYESKRYVQSANLAYMGASNEINLRLGLESGNWIATLWVENLTNDDTPEAVTRLLDFREFIFIPDDSRASGYRGTFIRDFAVSAPKPRQVGVTFSYSF